jgi:hypothetical protein
MTPASFHNRITEIVDLEGAGKVTGFVHLSEARWFCLEASSSGRIWLIVKEHLCWG